MDSLQKERPTSGNQTPNLRKPQKRNPLGLGAKIPDQLLRHRSKGLPAGPTPPPKIHPNNPPKTRGQLEGIPKILQIEMQRLWLPTPPINRGPLPNRLLLDQQPIQ